MQFRAAQDTRPANASMGNENSNIAPENGARHSIRMLIGLDGAELEMLSGNKWVIFAIVLSFLLTNTGCVVLLKIL